MRRRLIALCLGAALSSVGPARAAPTCQDADGETIKCGAPGAMPVGWTLPEADRWDRQFAHPSAPDDGVVRDLVLLLFAIFALIALMPPFDGWNDGDWDPQEGDDPPQG